MSDDTELVIPKRKRVTVACDGCRFRKTKCDGTRPVCGRCTGYGYRCTWDGGRDREAAHEPSQELDNPLERFRQCQCIIEDICSALPSEERAKVAEHLVHLQQHINAAVSLPEVSLTPDTDESGPLARPSGYLGEVSDIHFFNLAKKQFCLDDTQIQRAQECMDTYDQDVYASPSCSNDLLVDLSAENQTDAYLEAYFSTIHIAYPFIPKSSFIRRYRSLASDRSGMRSDSSSLAQFYAVLAIGAYYTSFTGGTSPTKLLHHKYFQRSIYLSDLDKLQRSVTHVSTLLTQCFYLLAVSKTDGCWATLGIAIRIAQSLGLHTNTEAPRGAETRRRLWYSLYVLDRLVALQLGRPPAICDSDCYTSLPSRTDDLDHDWDTGDPTTMLAEEPSVGDYFLRVIEFSSIVGRVLGEIYNPRRDISAKLLSTKACDEQLLAWKQRLPRYLRFDIGHAFERSIPFRRQRNMLAVKFHHLRALMYRPYLCFPLLEKSATDSVRAQVNDLQRYGAVCVSEAQEMARLLHNVFEEVEVVHEFPWWQMISCFVCAGSILIVANACVGNGELEGFDRGALDYDADICLRAFDALSRNSDSAKMAKDMMSRLREQSAGISNSRAGTEVASQDPVLEQDSTNIDPLGPPGPMPTFQVGDLPPGSTMPLGSVSFDVDAYLQRPEIWPLEMNDSLAWSAQFFDKPPGLEDAEE